MRVKTWRGVTTWLHGALLSSMAYSALTLFSEPALAAECTPEFCQNGAWFQANAYCAGQYGVFASAVYCPSAPGQFSFDCAGGLPGYVGICE